MMDIVKKIKIGMTFALSLSLNYASGDCNPISACNEEIKCCECESVCCGGTLFFSADLLYWRAYQGGLETCVPKCEKEFVTSEGTEVTTFEGSGRDLHFKWNPGFRIGVGYEFACSDWEIAAIWTHFNSRSHDSRRDRDSVKWKIDLDVVDLIGAYEIDLTPSFALIPFAGVRGARIDQRLHRNQHSYLSNVDSEYSAIREAYASDSHRSRRFISNFNHNKERFMGVGPLIGLEGDWDIGCGFSVFAGASVSWMYGHFHVKFTEIEKSYGREDYCVVKKHLVANLAGADAAIGIQWETCFCSDKRLVLELGLEHHRYFDYNRMGSYGDLNFDGINFSVGFEF